MESIIVEVFVPSTSESFDFRLPATACVGDIAREMIDIFEATSQTLVFDRESVLLCDAHRGAILNPEQTVAEIGLRDGSRLMLL